MAIFSLEQFQGPMVFVIGGKVAKDPTLRLGWGISV